MNYEKRKIEEGVISVISVMIGVIELIDLVMI